MGIGFKNRLAVGATPVPDVFIDTYMAGASGEYVKVYLYLLRHQQEEVSIGQIADALNHTEADVQRALAYWQRAGIELKENIDEGDTDLRSVIEGDSKRYSQNESFGNYGYQEQEFKDGELTDVEHDEYTAEADGYTDDDYADVSDDNGSDDEE